MKELSIEEKAKRYDDRLEKARKWYDANTNEGYKGIFEDIFPELKESEDERIRKELLAWLKSRDGQTLPIDRYNAAIAWLEKQVEQKPADKSEPTDYNSIDPYFGKPIDKVEPKFRNGQWIVWQDKCYKVNYNGCGYELVDQDGLSTSLEYGTIDENAHRWTIQDAKPGDIIYLPNGNNEYYFFIFKGIENAAVMSFAHFYKYNDGTYKVEGTKDKQFSVNDVFRPATKEQREQLLKAISDAGFAWDAEKKELKKVEQSSAWSEEDEYLLGETIQHLEELIRIDKAKHCSIDVQYYQRDIDWLKSLKDRVQPQPEQEWSEEDKRNIQDIDSVLFYDRGLSEDTCMRLRNWLKSLRPQNHWKPSDEQMDVLLSEVTAWTKGCPKQIVLESLYNDLKKLKG